ncbi:hypothetical protein SDC9_89941 [bioreactor metagenome]|uniref:Uncharacterized protein n=1 Tax=bioreactor metagenome TaxID=1076179 RepID=A0A644ZSA0_9ZZZZ
MTFGEILKALRKERSYLRKNLDNLLKVGTKMNKKLIFLIAVPFLITTLIGCSSESTVDTDGNNDTKNTSQIAQIEVYSATEHTKIRTIEDTETLASFSENTDFNYDLLDEDDDYLKQQEEYLQQTKEYDPQYTFITYKKTVAINNDDDLEEVMEITTYKDTNMIMMQISPDSIKNMKIPSEYLTYYYEVSDEVTDYLSSLCITD